MSWDINKLFKDFTKLRIAVIGDVMLDTYWWGHVERISPEAPVPVVTVDKKEQRIGGAGNVVLNAHSLGTDVYLLSVTGNDDEGKALRKIFDKKNINTDFLLSSSDRTTTNKIRITGRNQQMMRIDAESTDDLSEDDENNFIKTIEDFISAKNPDVIILQDYNKGVLTPKVISFTLNLCKQKNIISAVDPKRKNFFEYKDAILFKPNLKEVKENLNILSLEVALPSLKNIHQTLSARLHNKISLITLSEKGIFYEQDDKAAIVSAHIRSIADVSGAGDTVIAVAALTYAASKDVALAAEVANIAGGLVCEQAGTSVIDKNKLFDECKMLLG